MKRGIRALLLGLIGTLLFSIPVAAASIDSVDIRGSDASYQAMYEAYTKAASAADAAVCELKIGDPDAGSNGALCRIELPDDTAYLYMDEGDLAVLMYYGSEYQKFQENYQLRSDITYTLCVFQDGLAFFDGMDCYTFTVDLSGFSDVISGWSDSSNVFETTLTRREPGAEGGPVQDTASQPQTEAEAAAAAADAQSARSRPSGWVILALILSISGNVIALTALRVAVPVQRTPARHSKRRAPAKRSGQSGGYTHVSRQPYPRQKRSNKASVPAQSQKKRTANERLKEYESILGDIAADAVQKPAEPFDLYMDKRWRNSRRALLQPYRFGDPGSGLCTFVEGHDLNSDPFVLLDHKIWLNPMRFYPKGTDERIVISTAEASGISIAFDFYRVNTSEREIVILEDVEMVNFQPAHTSEKENGVLELAERGVIVFTPVERIVAL